MKPSITRRQFLKRNFAAISAAAISPALVPATVLGREGAPSPNSRIQVGCIGVGPQGRGVMGNFLAQDDCRVVAVCDVARRNLNQALGQVNEQYADHACATYHDYLELLERKDIDAVLIAPPDHWHVAMALDAARAGKDLYLEKPMGLSVAEDQLLREVVRKEKRIFQFGTQQRSSSQFRQACELARSGKIGTLKAINVWANASRPGGATALAPIPPDLDYERWLGPAPESPFTVDKCFDTSLPDAWKTWWFNYDYALGFIAGWGVHPLDIAYWGHPAIFGGPLKLEGRGIFPGQGACNTSIAWDVQFQAADGVTLNYRGTRNGYDQVSPMNDLSSWDKKYGHIVDHGTAFEGSEGWILVDRSQIRTSPESLIEEKNIAIRLPRSSNHTRNFLDSIRSRSPAISSVEDAVQADILCHLSDIATRLNRPLTWNPDKETFVKDGEANRRLELRPRRKPWKLKSSSWIPFL
jgi:predicted dehydrogenase